jgi:hydrogenase-4 component B
MSLIVLAIALTAASGLISFAFPRESAHGQRVSTLFVVLGSLSGLAGAGMGLFGQASESLIFPWPAVGDSLVGLDPLGAFFLVPVFLIGALASIYGLGYWPQKGNRRTGRSLQFFFGLMVAGMALLVVARHALAFLFGWEGMALSGFFLINTESRRSECRRASFIYFIATHLGTLALFGMFALWHRATGSFDLTPASSGSLSSGAMTGIFLLALLGFGLKAGVMPLHFWLPGAHATAPSHVSAMFSGVMLKMGIYGILRVLWLVPDQPASWGALILALGAVSGLLGVVFAIAQHDMKKLLAYHSVENIGIILMGLGVAMLGRASGHQELFVLGMAGCLLHVWNHSLFKSLLFFGAGSAVHATGTRRIDRLGGLGKAMPWTSAFFLVGAVAICGLPPLNGFVSELFIYLGLFRGLAGGGAGYSIAAIVAPCLALVGALAIACFVKVCGVSFLGIARSPEAERAKESPRSMLIPMAALVVACAFIGLAPFLLVPVLDSVLASWGPASPSLGSVTSLGFVSMASVATVLIAGILALILAAKPARRTITWDCGYARPTSRMQYTASSFARGIVAMFGWVLRPREEIGRLPGHFPEAAEMEGEVDEAVLDRAITPFFRMVERLSRWFHRFQAGIVQQYVLYIFIALALLLLTLIPRGRIAP